MLLYGKGREREGLEWSPPPRSRSCSRASGLFITISCMPPSKVIASVSFEVEEEEQRYSAAASLHTTWGVDT